MKTYIKDLGKPRRLSIGILVIISILMIANIGGLEGYVAEAVSTNIQNVFVTNTQSEPIPVKGSVNVTNTPTVNIGTGSVDITGTPNVNIANNISNPAVIKEVDNPLRQPFQYGDSCQINTGALFCTISFDVPSNKLAVIEYVSLIGSVPSGQPIDISISIQCCSGSSTGGTLGWPLIPQLIHTYNNFDEWGVNQQVRLYADPGSRVVFRTSLLNPATVDFLTFHIRFSGFFVDR